MKKKVSNKPTSINKNTPEKPEGVNEPVKPAVPTVSPETASMALAFLDRVQLQGAEVEAYLQVRVSLLQCIPEHMRANPQRK